MRFFTRLRVLTKHPRVLAPNDITSQLFVATHIVLSYTRCSLLPYFPLLHPYEGKRHNIKTSRDDDGDDTRDTGWMTATGRKGSGTLCIQRIFHTGRGIYIEFTIFITINPLRSPFAQRLKLRAL